MKFSAKSLDFPPAGHRALVTLHTRGLLFIVALLLGANIIYGQLVTHNSMVFSVSLGGACLLGGILMAAFPDTRLVKHYNTMVFGIASGTEQKLRVDVIAP